MTMLTEFCGDSFNGCVADEACLTFLTSSMQGSAPPTAEEAAAVGPKATVLLQCYMDNADSRLDNCFNHCSVELGLTTSTITATTTTTATSTTTTWSCAQMGSEKGKAVCECAVSQCESSLEADFMDNANAPERLARGGSNKAGQRNRKNNIRTQPSDEVPVQRKERAFGRPANEEPLPDGYCSHGCLRMRLSHLCVGILACWVK